MPSIETKFFTRVRNFAQPDSCEAETQTVDIEFPTAPFVIGDMIRLVEIPAGVMLQDYAFVFQDIDSNASPTFAFSFGVMNAAGTNLDTVYATGITAGQSNAIVRALNSDSSFDAVNNVRARNLGIRVTAVAATYNGAGRAGTVLLALRG